MKCLTVPLLSLFFLSFVPLTAQTAFSAHFLDGRINALEIYARDGRLQQQIRYHYSLHGGVWYPSAADITSGLKRGDPGLFLSPS